MMRADGAEMWERLERFRITEPERRVLRSAEGWECFTVVDSELVGDRGMRRRLLCRLRRDGNVEKGDEFRAGRVKLARRRYGRVVARMPSIAEAGEDVEGEEGCLVGDEAGEVGGDDAGRRSDDSGDDGDDEAEAGVSRKRRREKRTCVPKLLVQFALGIHVGAAPRSIDSLRMRSRRECFSLGWKPPRWKKAGHAGEKLVLESGILLCTH